MTSSVDEGFKPISSSSRKIETSFSEETLIFLVLEVCISIDGHQILTQK
jgi:hypothetical protein